MKGKEIYVLMGESNDYQKVGRKYIHERVKSWAS